MVSKVLRTLPPIYVIRVSSIQEMRHNSDINLDVLVGRLTIFELDNFDNYSPNPCNIEFAFKAKLNLYRKDRNSKGKHIDDDDGDEYDEDL